MKPPGITNPHQTDPQKRCERCDNSKIETTLYIYTAPLGTLTRIMRLCNTCVTEYDEPLNKSPRFERRRVLLDHNRR